MILWGCFAESYSVIWNGIFTILSFLDFFFFRKTPKTGVSCIRGFESFLGRTTDIESRDPNGGMPYQRSSGVLSPGNPSIKRNRSGWDCQLRAGVFVYLGVVAALSQGPQLGVSGSWESSKVAIWGGGRE